MSELVGMSFDADAFPSVRFQSPNEPESERPKGSAGALYGWGVGWYPSSERGASVVKDPTSSAETNVSDVLGDWKRFRSTIFLSHLRGHERPRKQQDAQPFVRSYGGRQWIFVHDGDLSSDWATRLPLPDDPSFEPLGRTDSEHAFCWLLSRIHAQRSRSLADVSPEQLRAWLLELNLGGQLNALLTDGEHLVAFHDSVGRGQLHWVRRLPPHPVKELASKSIRISLDAPEDSNRTALLFATTPLSSDAWHSLAPGELVIARRGSILWDSHADETRSTIRTSDPGATPNGETGGVGDFAGTDVLSGPTMTGQTMTGQPITGQPLSDPPLAAQAMVGQSLLQGNLPGQVPAGQQNAAAYPIPVSPTLTFPELKRRTLRVTHVTQYDYAQAIKKSSHRFLVRPTEDRQQVLLDHSIDIEPSVPWRAFDDVFGNAALAIEINEPFDRLKISACSTVTVYAQPSLEQRAAFTRTTTPPVWMPWQRQMLSAYLLPPELPETQLQELSRFAMSFAERNDFDLVGTLLDLNETLYRDFEYVSGSTTNSTTAFEVFESRRGVCQDFANLMICLARLLQVPARYRMGYIFTSADYANQIQSEASHAWVEVYVPQVGWHGFDPTNGIQVGADHVRVACGRNYLDATPTTGTIYQGGGTETLRVSVRVEEVSLPLPLPLDPSVS